MTPASNSKTFCLAVWSLWRREVIRFVRQRSRVIGALGTPIVFWFIIGSGFGTSFKPPESTAPANHLQYGFPGTLALIVLFTAIFSMISVIEDRQAGFLQGVLVAPVGRSAIVFGKMLGSSTLAVAQAALFLFLAPLTGVPLSINSLACTLGVLVVVALSLSALGFWLAWSMESTQGFHAVMNLVLMPMWLLSGAFFPASGAANWLAWLMAVNPLSFGVSALRHAVFAGSAVPQAAFASFPVSLGIMAGFGLLMLVLSIRTAAMRS